MICQDILNYYISTFDSQLCRRGRGVPSILYVEDFFKQKDITEPTFKNFYSNGLSWETLKLCLDFLWNTTSFWYILWLQVEHLDLIILWRKIPGFFFSFKGSTDEMARNGHSKKILLIYYFPHKACVSNIFFAQKVDTKGIIHKPCNFKLVKGFVKCPYY